MIAANTQPLIGISYYNFPTLKDEGALHLITKMLLKPNVYSSHL